jgi:EAL domain-containing protein (putative c-di-GMP-specific phosphodiesterase class I)/FixJ family two-component response regulator
MTLMVVDDDVLVTTLMTLSLGELGFDQVCVESSSEGALRQIDAGLVPSVIFCDLQMPGIDGIELLRHLGSRRYSGGVVLLSATDWKILKSCEDMGRSLGLHMLGILQKPFEASAIADLLRATWQVREQLPAQVAPITEEDLRAALDGAAIETWYQPQFDAVTLLPVGVEALARWRHPQHGFVSPLAFVSLAETCGLIDILLYRVFGSAMQTQGALLKSGLDTRMSVNLSARNLHDHTLPERLTQIAAEAGVSPQSVVIEVTESHMTEHAAVAQEILARLRLKGFGLSIDDYGTGYSSITQLHRLPFTELKIDGSFVRAAAHDPRAYAIFESSVHLAHKLEVLSVAEGIETEAQLAIARALGCEVVQGYLFSRALPAGKLADRLLL